MQFFATLFVLLSASNLAAAIPEKYPAAKLVVRQTTSITTAPVSNDACLDYSMTANMSTWGANGTYRTVFLQKANQGTIISARMLNAAILKLPALTANAALNAQCGNLTTVALTEAEKNFTQGMVAQFTTAGLPVGIKAGPEMIVILLAVCSILSGVWIFAP